MIKKTILNEKNMEKPAIHIAFRFHGNFYHSYRGDTPDESGFGKDIRIIRHLIDTLDDLNQRGIPVRGTWDFENYFSLEKIMPKHCPDIITDMQRRIRDGDDEAEMMSYNNGLINAHTAREFEAAIRQGISNPQGSGLQDLFGDGYYGMVRPQEMMYTPIHLKLYPAYGIKAISLFYSALPFNGFSNFVPPLSLVERYNPITITYPDIDESMILMPCYNIGDLADHLTLRRWVKQMRREQLKLENPQDLLLLIDMDADDEFWVGFDIPILGKTLSTARGLRGLVENIADLDYVRFTTPGEYLETHPPVGTLTFGQDTADGSFDGLSSWAEKWSNQRLWTGLERARIMELQVKRLLGGKEPEAVKDLLNESFDARLKILSTTHFGMAAPVMNLTREKAARNLVDRAVTTANAALEQSMLPSAPKIFSLLDYTRGISTGQIEYADRPSRALVRLPLTKNAPDKLSVKNTSGQPISSTILSNGNHRDLLFVDEFQPAERKDFSIQVSASSSGTAPASVKATDSTLENESIKLSFSSTGQVDGLQADGMEFSFEKFIDSGVTYAGKRYQVKVWSDAGSHSAGVIGLKRTRGQISLKGVYPVQFEREIMLAAGLPYIYIRMRVSYPLTPSWGYDKGKAQRLQQDWDNRWQEVLPCEISPSLNGTADSPLRVWKHNYCNHISTFDLDYGRFSKNVELDSVNNQITHAWLAVSDGKRGLLVAQNADALSNMAFCPLRTRKLGENSRVSLNPFGSYSGRQYRYGIADTGLGNMAATTFSASDHINPYAPSYNGRVQEFDILIAPYAGDSPPESIQYDAEAFAYPYLVIPDADFIAPSPLRAWDGSGMGEKLAQQKEREALA
jgi:hypothetical protein